MAGTTTAGEPRRHPSAGNLSRKPTLVEADGPPSLPPASFPHGDDSGRSRVRFGPALDDDALLRLVGPLEGRRVLDLGCGAGASSVALARAGARVTAVDPSTARLTRARHAADLAEVKVEFHHCDLADLAFVRADSVDAALAVYSLAQVQDLGRVFRQLHRVMVPDAPLVISLPHPMASMLEWDPEEQASPWLSRSFWVDHPLAWHVAGDEGVAHVHQISAVFTSLQRANFRVDTVLEPRPEPDNWSAHRSELDAWVPPSVVLRGRKVGT
jgi:SAM-dependent methyltransferase